MASIHDFKECLAFSHEYANASWWIECYRSAFPNLASCVEVRSDGWAQRAGIDRVLTLACGKTVKIDEKVRKDDYGDILLEAWSNKEREVLGWVRKPLDCDFIAYAVIPTRTCYLLPTLILQKTWRDNVREWWELGKARRSGFRIVDARNSGYTTQSLAVPTGILLSCLTKSIVVQWTDSQELV